jgi:hypothetical protein
VPGHHLEVRMSLRERIGFIEWKHAHSARESIDDWRALNAIPPFGNIGTEPLSPSCGF